MTKKDFSPTVYQYKDSVMEHVENSDLFSSYLKTTDFTQIYDGTLWAEGPCYIPHNDMLVWSDNPNNRMMKLINGQVSEFRNPSNFCNGNTIDNEENLISCSLDHFSCVGDSKLSCDLSNVDVKIADFPL